MVGSDGECGESALCFVCRGGGFQRARAALAGAWARRSAPVRCFRMGRMWSLFECLVENEIAFRIYERGCGPTTSSGTGTCASSAAAMALRGVARELTADGRGWCAADGVAGERCGDAVDRAGGDHLSWARLLGCEFEECAVKPAALRPGATLAVLSPASTPKPELVQRWARTSAGAGVSARC